MRDEAGQIAGDGPCVFSDAHAAALLIDHPDAEDRPTHIASAVWKVRLRPEPLIDALPVSVGSWCRNEATVRVGKDDVRTLA